MKDKNVLQGVQTGIDSYIYPNAPKLRDTKKVPPPEKVQFYKPVALYCRKQVYFPTM